MRKGGVAPVSGPERGGEAGAPGVQAAGRPETGGAGRPASSRKAPRAGQRPGEEGQARGPAEAYAPPAAPSPWPRRPRGPRQARPPHLAAAPSSSPGRRSWAAAATGPVWRGRRKEEGRGGRERREGRGGVAAEEAGAAGPGVRGKGEPSQTRRPPLQTLKSRSGARSPAGSDGGGACARPRPPPASMPGPTPSHLKFEPQVPAGAAPAPASARHFGSLAGWALVWPASRRPAPAPREVLGVVVLGVESACWTRCEAGPSYLTPPPSVLPVFLCVFFRQPRFLVSLLSLASPSVNVY